MLLLSRETEKNAHKQNTNYLIQSFKNNKLKMHHSTQLLHELKRVHNIFIYDRRFKRGCPRDHFY